MRRNRQIRLDSLEHGLLVRALYETWLDMRAAGVSAEDMGALILKVIDAPAKKSIWRCRK